MAVKKLKQKKAIRSGKVPLGTKKPIRVDLPGGPSAVVEATDTAQAWQLYKELCGVRSTDHQPRFSRPGPDCETDENGIVVDNRQKGLGQKKPDSGNEDWDIDDMVTGDEDEE